MSHRAADCYQLDEHGGDIGDEAAAMEMKGRKQEKKVTSSKSTKEGGTETVSDLVWSRLTPTPGGRGAKMDPKENNQSSVCTVGGAPQRGGGCEKAVD